MGNQVYLIGEHKDGRLKKVTLEILGELIKQGQSPALVLLGSSGLDLVAQEAAKNGPSKVICLESPALASYSTEGYANALYSYLSKQNATVIVSGSTSQGKDYLPRLSAKFQVGYAADCTEFQVGASSISVRRPIYAGKCSKKVEFIKTPAVFSVRPNVLQGAVATTTQAPIEKVPAEAGEIRAKITQEIGSGAKKVDLTEADIIISGGRALQSADNFKILYDCADVVGAAVGASRAAVDAGYAPHSLQVGQTGKTVSPKLYIACGISGAIQHLAGMRTSKVIVAINKDPEAPIFQKADYGIVADLFQFIPLLTEEFKKLKAQS